MSVSKTAHLYRWGIAIAGIALFVRLSYALMAPNVDPFLKLDPLHGDAASYDRIIRSLLANTGYSQYPPKADYFWPPLFPLLMWVIYKVAGYHLLVGRLALALIGSAVAPGVYLIGHRLFGARVGKVAGIGAAIYPHFVFFGAWLIADPLYFSLLVASLLVAVWLQENAGFRQSLLLGLLLGLSALAKPTALFMLPGFFVWFLVAIRQSFTRRIVLGATTALVMIITMSPWLIRNYLDTGRVFLSTNGGYTFYGANNPQAFGGHREGFPPPLPGLTEAEQDLEYYRLGFQWIRDNPNLFLRLVGRKYARLLSPLSVASWENDYPLPFATMIRLLYWAFFGCAITGAVLQLRFWRKCFVLYIPVSAVLLSTLLFYGDTRFGLPMVPSLLLFASVAVVRLYIACSLIAARFMGQASATQL